MSGDDVQRSLGKIEGLLEGIKAEQLRVAEQLEAHTAADAINFASLQQALASITGSKRTTVLWATLTSSAVVGLIQTVAMIVN